MREQDNWLTLSVVKRERGEPGIETLKSRLVCGGSWNWCQCCWFSDAETEGKQYNRSRTKRIGLNQEAQKREEKQVVEIRRLDTGTKRTAENGQELQRATGRKRGRTWQLRKEGAWNSWWDREPFTHRQLIWILSKSIVKKQWWLWGDAKGAVGPCPILSKWMSHHPWSQHSWKRCCQALEKPWAGWEWRKLQGKREAQDRDS